MGTSFDTSMLIPKLSSQPELFLNLVARCFGRVRLEEVLDELPEEHDTIKSEADFDLFLWSLAHQFKVDTEELLRQLGERWGHDLILSEFGGYPSEYSALRSIDWLLSQTNHFARSPILGAKKFRTVIMSRGPDSVRVCCLGPRRCCSFLEGVARGFGALSGESVRYIRQPQSATLVELLIQTFEKK